MEITLELVGWAEIPPDSGVHVPGKNIRRLIFTMDASPYGEAAGIRRCGGPSSSLFSNFKDHAHMIAPKPSFKLLGKPGYD
jgi:hypothetical protein